MNKLEELANNNKENYERYLKRMTDSMKCSTKGLIPFLASNGKNILDVGCGSGVMLSALENENNKSKLTGIDLKELKKDWKLFCIDFMKLHNVSFDTIIFSSILHEISSYNNDPNKRFTSEPINEALNKSNQLLTDDGIVIIRDGLLMDEANIYNQLIISFTNPNDASLLYRFQKEFRGFDKLEIDNRIIRVNENQYVVAERFLKEFLCTYTWGEESFNREINERFGILTEDEWINLLNQNGFSIEFKGLSCEEYEKYLKKKINITDLYGNKYEYPYMSILIKARKKVLTKKEILINQ